MIREIQRLALAFVLGFVTMGLVAAYWAVVERDSVLSRDDNPRRVQAEARLLRGALYDRHERLLVSSTTQANGRALRRTWHEAFYGTLGYASLRYGVGGLEAVYDPLLRGQALAETLAGRLERDLLHRPQRGFDLRLSLDLGLQERLATLMEGKRGAVVALNAQTGEMLALLSRPSYNPNTLDADWEALTVDTDNPFFNRVLQGRYQPGGALQTVHMLTALLRADDLAQVYEGAAQPVTLDDLRLSCALPAEREALTLAEAYRLGCPAAFLQWSQFQPEQSLSQALQAFGLLSVPSIDGMNAASGPVSEASVLLGSSKSAEILGQGRQTISPLALARLLMAARNEGSAPPIRLLLAIRPPDGEWQLVEQLQAPQGFITRQAAEGLSALLRDNLASAGRAYWGGHVALANSGQQALGWFVGFVDRADWRVVLVAVLEEQADGLRVLAFGLDALRAIDQP
ncbi:MAG: penicillin-binding transpeptidase domain-containing protein [Anaerolineae bacterium]|nr:penicillin-binding transpeptidase domain-containing protein [Anaerolineae bacterium]MDW8173182.1 penicillin-binding transpeptidase domain-containing protein [Anaerolineae bacterium]